MTTETRSQTRNTFLDLVRTVAILRVVVWHTYGYAWISYLVASMPAMFFLAGSLMAYSLRRGGAHRVIFRRLQRLLIPFWLLAIVALSVMLLYEGKDLASAARFDHNDILWWILPVWDPQASEWGITWWAPLWYVRCLVWLLLLTPPLLWLWRRIGLALLVLPLAGLALAEQQQRAGVDVPWQLQDLALYSFFWVAGFAYNDGLFSRLNRAMRVGLCVTFVALSAAWALTQDVPAGVVNASYPLHLFVGLAWLFGSLSIEGAIARFATRPRVADVLYWVNERALTIYLWQAVGLFAMYQILWTHEYTSLARDLLALPIVAAVTFLAVLLFGWLEDIAANRSPRLWPTRSGASGRIRLNLPVRTSVPAAAVLLVAVTALFVAGRNIVEDPAGVVQAGAHTAPPSGAGLHLRAQRASIGTVPPARHLSGRTEPVTPEELQMELEAWLAKWGIAGASASILRPTGETWTGASGFYDSGAPFGHSEPYAIASVTKTFTAALVLRLADRKRLSLDDKVSKYVPDFPHADRFTIRHLLQHTSGLILGDEMPHDGLNQAAAAGLQFPPGKGYLYSRAGYFLLGLVIEDVLGKSYSNAVHDELLTPLELGSTFMDEELLPLPFSTHPYQAAGDAYEGVLWTSGRLFRRLAEPTFDYQGALWSAGGLWSSTNDLSRWALALWGSDAVLSRPMREQMTTFLAKEFDYTGLGTYPFCPCWRERNQLRAERWGFAGITGVMEYDPEDRVALVIHVSGTILDPGVLEALQEFSERFRVLIRGRAFVTETQ